METGRAVVILGRESLSSDELQRVESYREVIVIERPEPDPRDRFLVDEARAYAQAQHRLREVLAALRADAVHASGFVGDEDPEAARHDAHELYPDAVVIEREADEIAVARPH